MSAVKSPNLVLKKVMDLPVAVAGFYVQEAVMAKVHNMKETSMKLRLEDDIKEFQSIHQKYADRLAGAFFDYIALASFGEARHAPSQAKRYIPQICYKWNRNNKQQSIHVREKSYKHALKFDPYRFLPTLATLFYDGIWRDSYGGSWWGNIAEAGTMYKKVTSTVFIDHAVDLSHNGGSMFSKSVLFLPYDSSHYRHMLGMKTAFSILDDNDGNTFLKKFWVAQNAKPFLKLAVKLDLISADMIYSTKYAPVQFPETIKWGLLPITKNDILSCDELPSSEKLDEDDYDDENPIEMFEKANIRKSHVPLFLDELKAKFKPMEQASMF